MTVSNEPSAPPPEDEIPVVTAQTIPDTTDAVPTIVMGVPAKTAPPGMCAKTVTTTYPDGRKVTTTEYVPESTAAPAPAAPTALIQSQYHPPRRDLGGNPVSVTCPYCSQTGLTRANQQCGECFWVSVILLLLFCFPFAWIPLVCPNVSYRFPAGELFW
jgi:hypothetical protein